MKMLSKRHYENELKAKGIRTPSIISLDKIVSKIKTSATSERYLIVVMLDALFKQLNADDVEVFKQECLTKIEAVQHQNSNHDNDNDNDNANTNDNY